jgi:transcriptional regulator with XRE-family HTH domain
MPVNSYNVQIELRETDTIGLPKVDLAKLCQEIRTKLGLSRLEMAQMLDVSESAYNHYEAGRRDPNGQSTAKLFLLREKLIQSLLETPLQK